MTLVLPPHLKLANVPTKIEKLEKLSDKLGGPEIYVKRDDQTGTEWTGNKVRKLEFLVKEALNKGCDYLITCGGIQSNHCRATAAVAVKMGLKVCLVLRGSSSEPVEGNLFLDKLLGADVVFISADDYSQRRNEIMEEIAEKKMRDGLKPYIIPEGASNGLGALGYYRTMEEIVHQEQKMKLNFNAIVVAVGSGGTYAGLALGKKDLDYKGTVYGVNVAADAAYFEQVIRNIFDESCELLDSNYKLGANDVNIIDGYVGRGYALSTAEELAFITGLARLEGLILDNVYTGKAMYGLAGEIAKGRFKKSEKVLFIHTGGMFELFSQMRFFEV